MVAEKLIPGDEVEQVALGRESLNGVMSIQSISLVDGLVNEEDFYQFM